MPPIMIFLDRYNRQFFVLAVMTGAFGLLTVSVLSAESWATYGAAVAGAAFGWVAGSVSMYNAIMPGDEPCDIDDTDQ